MAKSVSILLAGVVFSLGVWGDQALEPLPLGSIVARGWLREQLSRSRDGMGGHLDELEPQMIATPYTTREIYKGWGKSTLGWGGEVSRVNVFAQRYFI